MMFGYLAARAGVDVLVMEKHADFLRDFRGDTVHPSTLQVMHELGLLDEFLRRPHRQVQTITGFVGSEEVTMADFSHLPVKCPFIAFMPQWEFLNFLEERGRAFANFQLRMKTEATDLIEENGRVVGVRAKSPAGEIEVRADLVIGADGRNAISRDRAGMKVKDIGAPMDVLWMKLPRASSDPNAAMGRFDRGKIFVMLDRGDYYQCAFVIPKGTLETLRQRGLDAFRQDVAEVAPFMRDRLDLLRSWDDIRLLTVRVDRLVKWYREGFLCIGDAAHAMSPVGGVGINLAIQDAVAAANILAPKLCDNLATRDDLRRVQARRMFPTRVTQAMQVLVQNRVISRALAAKRAMTLPLPLRIFRRFPILRRIPARLIGMGIRPEHVKLFNQKQQ